MILMHRALNIVFPLAMLILLLIILPPYLVFKLLSYIKRSIFSENVAGKVVLITGASSGIGEDLAYEYAVRGARLALVARREDRLRAVADKARNLGSPNVFHVRADVSKVEDCKRIIDETLNHFGHLDHLVNNAGISQAEYFEDCTEVSDLTHIMDVNFWGSAFCSRFAIPHLKRSKGKIVVISSVAPWSRTPKLSVYNASKAALISFYDTLRVEIGSHIGITIVMPGLIDTEMTSPSSLAKYSLKFCPPNESANQCAQAIVKSTCRGDRYLTEPSWWNALFIVKSLCPEALDLLLCWNFMVNGAQKERRM
ncbi:PREDICTED: 11-beta-hydroxysteroid dehydrogenase-like 4A [Populus euphratica]|uniref:11-beta-hydroxysteroid dehydrogenase-like 4A n=1 Tax=Populus euphratica TaxID=75702 RepID=A0AAJ6XVY5_POPEU|nr:PREDICTED: 11-beta-hydroxysteroid dehydrogenase-like 4A [Populus euphratica]